MNWINDLLQPGPSSSTPTVTSTTGATASELLELIAAGGAPWRRDALCREYPDLEWIPRHGDDIAPLKAICRRCPVQLECLAEALPDPTVKGVWGGTSGKDRDLHRRGRRLISPTSEASDAAVSLITSRPPPTTTTTTVATAPGGDRQPRTGIPNP